MVGGLPEPQPRQVPRLPAAAINGAAPAAVEGVLRKVRAAAEGERNSLLNWGAFTLGRRVAAGTLDAGEVAQQLRDAALDAGLEESEVDGTIRSGLDAGASA